MRKYTDECGNNDLSYCQIMGKAANGIPDRSALPLDLSEMYLELWATWRKYWTPWDELSEEAKENDRRWVGRVLGIEL